MERILNQEEIDALFRRAQSQKASSKPAHQRTITRCNFSQPGMSKESVRSLSALHEGFARNVTTSVAAFLRVPFDLNLVSVEQISYIEFLQRIPELTYLASLGLNPLDLVSFMQLDLAIAFPIVDLLLGGKGSALSEKRDLTEIEEQILETVLKILTRELQRAWEAMQLEFVLERRQQQTQVLHLMPPTDRLLSVTFEIRMQESRGNLNIAIPAVVASMLLRKLSEQWTTQKRSGASESAARLREILAECPFELELTLPERAVSARELLNMRAGSILPLPIPLEDPGIVDLGGRQMFSAEPIRSGNNKAAHIRARLAQRTPLERKK
jgi:flagellar motor switch protein FliM